MDLAAIVIDAGLTMIQAGFAGEEDMSSFSPSISSKIAASQYSIIDPVGPAPFKTKGLVTNWDQMENLWYHAYYNSLQVDPTERNVLHSVSPLASMEDRVRTAEISLETFNMAGTFMVNENMVTDYYKGSILSLSILMNEETINIVPIIEGRLIDEAFISLPFGGKDLTQHLLITLNNTQGCEFNPNSTLDLKIGRDIKEKLCFCDPADPDSGERGYELPDGQVITLNEERHLIYDALFAPTLLGFDDTQIGLETAIHEVINHCAPQDRRVLYNCISLAGGTANARGLAPRVIRKLQQSLVANSTIPACRTASQRHMNMRVRANTGFEHFSCWLGGSIMASLSTMSTKWITKAEWGEFGHSIVQRKCPLEGCIKSFDET